MRKTNRYYKRKEKEYFKKKKIREIITLEYGSEGLRGKAKQKRDCKVKRRFGTLKDALTSINEMHSFQRKKYQWEAYKCKYCKAYHLTSNYRRKTRPLS